MAFVSGMKVMPSGKAVAGGSVCAQSSFMGSSVNVATPSTKGELRIPFLFFHVFEEEGASRAASATKVQLVPGLVIYFFSLLFFSGTVDFLQEL